MTSKVEQKERSHETILASAARVLREHGIAGAKVAEVMKGAGLTVGGFYAHFDSKEALVDATLRRASADMRDRLFARLEEKPAADRAEVVLKRYLSVAHRDEFERGCALPAIIGEVATTAPEHGAVLGEQIDEMATRLEEHLPRGRRLSPRAVALALVALMYGGLSLSRALRGTPMSEEVLRACRAVGAFAARAGSDS